MTKTQAQRMLSAKMKKHSTVTVGQWVVKVSCGIGVLYHGVDHWGFGGESPDFMAEIASVTPKHFPQEAINGGVKADLMIPVFIVKYLPHGFIGLLMVAILSAAMSSLSSTVNSLSAVSVEDFFNRGKKKLEHKKYMFTSKMAAIFGDSRYRLLLPVWGSKSTVIEIINAIGSVFYGPVLVIFLLAFFSKK